MSMDEIGLGMTTHPRILVCGYPKSGTTIISKTLSFMLGLPLQNEVESLWQVMDMLDVTEDISILWRKISRSEFWHHAKEALESKPITKCPEGSLILGLLDPSTKVVFVVRSPLDAICAFMERKHRFQTTFFSEEELLFQATIWNYHVLAARSRNQGIHITAYEGFVRSPGKSITTISEYLKMPLVHELPSWVNIQAKPYYDLVPGGQPIRGLGRHKLSINAELSAKIVSICTPALNFLSAQGVVFADFSLLEVR